MSFVGKTFTIPKMGENRYIVSLLKFAALMAHKILFGSFDCDTLSLLLLVKCGLSAAEVTKFRAADREKRATLSCCHLKVDIVIIWTKKFCFLVPPCVTLCLTDTDSVLWYEFI